MSPASLSGSDRTGPPGRQAGLHDRRGERDLEVKLLIGCVPDEIAAVQRFFTTLGMGHRIVLRF